jgi:hypothetical protein
MKNTHIKIRVDNTTAVGYLQKQGGRVAKLNDLANTIWHWARDNGNWITSVYIPGVANIRADTESRRKHDYSEFELSTHMFNKITKQLDVQPGIDLFATRLNYKVEKYISLKRDPGAHYVDAFTVQWKEQLSYAFPPTNQIGRVLQKARQENACILLICPDWPSQVWYTDVRKYANKVIMFNCREVTHRHRDAPAQMYLAALINWAHPTK